MQQRRKESVYKPTETSLGFIYERSWSSPRDLPQNIKWFWYFGVTKQLNRSFYVGWTGKEAEILTCIWLNGANEKPIRGCHFEQILLFFFLNKLNQNVNSTACKTYIRCGIYRVNNITKCLHSVFGVWIIIIGKYLLDLV